MSFTLNYDEMIPLDSEFLAETGIGRAYDRVLPRLRQHVPNPAPIEELIDNDTPSYSVRFGNKEFGIYSPELDNTGESWTRATYALFAIVNEQLADSGAPYRFYAINGGNELAGMFLTPAQANAAQKTLPNKRDWPYIPAADPPWYGRHPW